jgi:hypothetical protein
VSAVARYLLAQHLGSHRWVAPFLFLLAGVVVLYAQPPNPVLSTAGTAAAWLLPAQIWLALSFLNTQEAGDRQTTVANAGPRTFALGRLLGLAVLALLASLVTLAFPVVSARFERPAHLDELALILVANLVCASAGSALAALFARPILSGRAAPVLGLMTCLIATIPLGVSPAVATARALDRTGAAEVPARIAPTLAAVAAFVGVALCLSVLLWRRRE